MGLGLQFQLVFNPPRVRGCACSQSHRSETHLSWWNNSRLAPFQLRSDPKKMMPILGLLRLTLCSLPSGFIHTVQACPFSSHLALQFVFSPSYIRFSWELSPLFFLFLLPRRMWRNTVLSDSVHGFWWQAPDPAWCNINGKKFGKEFWSRGNAKNLTSRWSCPSTIRSTRSVPAAWFSFHPPGKKRYIFPLGLARDSFSIASSDHGTVGRGNLQSDVAVSSLSDS